MEPLPELMFHCPACGVRLRLPAEQSGVSGPCPSCGEWIRSPAPLPLRPRGPTKGGGGTEEISPSGADSAGPAKAAVPPEAPSGKDPQRVRRRGRVSPLGVEQWSAMDQRESKRTVVVLLLFLATAALVYWVHRMLANP
jgi:hypothetical protein